MKTLLLKHLAVLLAVATLAPLAFAQSYHLTGSISLPGTGGWDYLSADSAGRRLYVSHGPEVAVIDLDSQKLVGTITGLGSIHGIVVVDAHKGFISDGGKNQVYIFDPATLAITGTIKTLPDPNSMTLDRSTGKLFVGHKLAHAMESIDVSTGQITGVVHLEAVPEFPSNNGAGLVFVNTQDTSEILKIDEKALSVVARWPVAPCKSPTGLAYDAASKKLFAACDNNMMAIIDAETGKVLETPATGAGPDAAAYDSTRNLAFSSNGQTGTLTVIGKKGDKFVPLQTVETKKSARTMALDAKTGVIYLSSAEMGPRPEPTPETPRPRAPVLAGSFKVLIVAP